MDASSVKQRRGWWKTKEKEKQVVAAKPGNRRYEGAYGKDAARRKVEEAQALPAAALATAAAATAPSAGWPKSPARLSHAHGIAANFGHLQATMQRERDRVGASAGTQSLRTVSGVRELAQQQEAEAGGIVRDRGGST